MNIFYLDRDPRLCAQAHVDKHVVKMVLEYAQLLSACHHLYRSKQAHKAYKLTHQHHPSTRWAALTADNYAWLYELFTETNNEYGFRYGKWHKSYMDLCQILVNNPCPKGTFTPPTPAMGDNYKIDGDSLLSYRNYYKLGKVHLHQWSKRAPPVWIV